MIKEDNTVFTPVDGLIGTSCMCTGSYQGVQLVATGGMAGNVRELSHLRSSLTLPNHEKARLPTHTTSENMESGPTIHLILWFMCHSLTANVRNRLAFSDFYLIRFAPGSIPVPVYITYLSRPYVIRYYVFLNYGPT